MGEMEVGAVLPARAPDALERLRQPRDARRRVGRQVVRNALDQRRTPGRRVGVIEAEQRDHAVDVEQQQRAGGGHQLRMMSVSVRRRRDCGDVDARLEIPPCPPEAVLALERALGVSSALGQVLVRRGLGDPAVARAFLAAQDEHDPALFAGIDRAVDADPASHRGADADHRPRRLRRRRRRVDRDPRARAALARRRRRLLPARAAARTATAWRPAPCSGSSRAARSCWSRPTARSRRSTRSRWRAPRGSTSSSPTTTRRAPTARCPTRRSSTRASAATRAPTCARAASPTSWRWRSARRRRSRTSTSSRWPPSPTASRWSARTAASCAPGWRRCGRPASRACGR